MPKRTAHTYSDVDAGRGQTRLYRCSACGAVCFVVAGGDSPLVPPGVLGADGAEGVAVRRGDRAIIAWRERFLAGSGAVEGERRRRLIRNPEGVVEEQQRLFCPECHLDVAYILDPTDPIYLFILPGAVLFPKE